MKRIYSHFFYAEQFIVGIKRDSKVFMVRKFGAKVVQFSGTTEYCAELKVGVDPLDHVRNHVGYSY